MKRPTLSEAARSAGVSYWTARRYAHAGVFEWVRDPQGVIRCERGAVKKIQRRYRDHGGPGGRALVRG